MLTTYTPSVIFVLVAIVAVVLLVKFFKKLTLTLITVSLLIGAGFGVVHYKDSLAVKSAEIVASNFPKTVTMGNTHISLPQNVTKVSDNQYTADVTIPSSIQEEIIASGETISSQAFDIPTSQGTINVGLSGSSDPSKAAISINTNGVDVEQALPDIQAAIKEQTGKDIPLPVIKGYLSAQGLI